MNRTCIVRLLVLAFPVEDVHRKTNLLVEGLVICGRIDVQLAAVVVEGDAGMKVLVGPCLLVEVLIAACVQNQYLLCSVRTSALNSGIPALRTPYSEFPRSGLHTPRG